MATVDNQAEVVKKKMGPELTLDDLHSYTLQLKDHDDSQRRGGGSLMGSTDGLMGSADSFSVGGESSTSSAADGGLNSDDLHVRNYHTTNSSLRMRAGSTDAMLGDESTGLCSNSSNTDWDYPDLDASTSGTSYQPPTGMPMARRSSRSSRPKSETRQRRLVHQDSTRVMIGDDKTDPDYQQLRSDI